MLKFVFNNKNSFDDMDCTIVGEVEYPLVAQDKESITIEGRKSGSLTKLTGNYKDLTVSLKLKLIDMKDYKAKVDRIQKWLESISNNKLYFSDNQTKCYLVKYVNFTTITPKNGYQANFEIEFICEPFMAFTNEKIQIVKNGQKLMNYGCESSEPMIKLLLPNETQNIQLEINDEVFTLKNASSAVMIDSQLFIVAGVDGMKTVGNFPKLKAGVNEIKWIGNIIRFEILQRTLLRG